MIVLGIDPGTTHTGWIVWNYHNNQIVNAMFKFKDNRVKMMGKDLNEHCLDYFDSLINRVDGPVIDCAGIEMFAGYGRPVGKSTFEACKWVGRFEQLCDDNVCTHMIYRKADVCTNLCKNTKAKDKDIRKALIQRYGNPGTKKNPGILYGVSRDIWSALAIAVTTVEKYYVESLGC
jgi:Holliday junction resolvasome RuvABC endonuclease subunit